MHMQPWALILTAALNAALHAVQGESQKKFNELKQARHCCCAHAQARATAAAASTRINRHADDELRLENP